jgi:hypothetical protein
VGAAVLSVAVCAFTAARHQAVIDQAARVDAHLDMLRARLARTDLDWDNIPPPSPVSVSPGHPFAADLNITGLHSIHQLLDTTVSLGGSLRLAGWLLSESPAALQIQARQELVRALLERPAFRARLESTGLLGSRQAAGAPYATPLQPGIGSQPGSGPTPARWDGSALIPWLEKHTPTETLRSRLILLSIVSLANLVLFVLYFAGLLPPYWLGTLALSFALQSLRYRETSEVFEESYSLARKLDQLRPVLVDLEQTPFTPGSPLAQLAAPICAGRQTPSAALRRIRRIVSAASLRNNPFLGLLLNILSPWDMYFAYQLERYKRDLRGLLPGWLETWYELEALSALANFAALNPESTFPDLLPEGSRPALECAGVGHPLIRAAARVANDFHVDPLGEVVIITGSNMSGKSTFLRTVGANLALAYAGGPVVADRLRVQPFRLFTSMNLADSLDDGISFFYAEVRRLRALLDALQSKEGAPLFFLIDEIFRGTNNRERQVGSLAYTTALAGRRGAGLISTHDLELAHLEDQIPQVRNLHFREDIRGDEMVFDYKIRSGPSPTTNALKIMALAGLPVSPAPQPNRDKDGVKNA